MGMFDKPQYLTGENGFASPGDTFWLHAARLDGTATVAGVTREQAKLLVSHTKDGDRVAVWTSGVAVVGQVKRMTAEDRSAMPMEVRLDQVDTGKGNPATVLTPAAMPAPAAGLDADPIAF